MFEFLSSSEGSVYCTDVVFEMMISSLSIAKCKLHLTRARGTTDVSSGEEAKSIARICAAPEKKTILFLRTSETRMNKPASNVHAQH